MTAFEDARLAFVSKLSKDERAILDSAAGPEGLLADIRSLDERHQEDSILRRFMAKIEPCVRGVGQYAQVMDVYSNAKPEVLSVLWGSVRIILRLAEDFLDTYGKLVDMLGRIGRQLGTLSAYSRLYPNSNRLYSSLVTSYESFFTFCMTCNDMLKEAHRSRTTWYKSSTLNVVAKSLWKPVKREFETSIGKLEMALDDVSKEADLAEKEEASASREKASAQAVFESHRSLFEWLDPVDPSSNYQRAVNYHEAGMGGWIFASPHFCEWYSTGSGMLWLHAKPGAGKTIIASTVITRLQSKASKVDDMVLYYFCDYKEPKGQYAKKMIQTLIAMICRQNNDALEMTDRFCKRYIEFKSACSRSELFELFLSCLATRKRIFLVVDALDECNDRADTIELLMSIHRKLTGVRIFLTSREESDIMELLQEVPQMQLEPKSTALDIELFINNELRRLVDSKKLRIRQPCLEITITDTLKSKADGMFQWVKCQFDVLCACISDKKILSCLESIPIGLDDTYIRILERIRREHHEDLDIIRKMLSWLVHSFRPLTISELAEAVSFEPDQRTLDFSAIPTESKDLLSLTGGLFGLASDDDTVGLSHYSVKEFLLSDRIKASSVNEFFQGGALVHLDLATTCVRYLKMDSFSDGPSRTSKRFNSRITTFKFVRYAASNWMIHHKAIPETATLHLDEELAEFFSDRDFSKGVQAMQQMELRERDRYLGFVSEKDFVKQFQRLSVAPDPLYYAALYGLYNLLLWFSESKFDINAEGGHYEYPLLAAAFGGHASWSFVEKMIDLGADIHLSSQRGNVAHANAILGAPQDWNLLKRLALCNIDLQEQSHYYERTVLQSIAEHPSDSSSVVEWLLNNGADMDDSEMYINEITKKHGDYAGPPLQLACTQGNLKIVSLLLSRGSNKNFGDCRYGTPLQAAVVGKHRKVIELLLEHQVDVNATGGQLGSPLQAAVWKGDNDMAYYLIQNGANIDAGGSFCGSPLSAAIDRAHWELVDMLLLKGANPDGNPYCKVPYRWMWDLSLDHNRNELYSRQPMNSAIYRDRADVVIKLLERGTNLNAIPCRCKASGSSKDWDEEAHPLCRALELDRNGIIDIIVANGADLAIGNFCPFLTTLSRDNSERFREFMEAKAWTISNSTIEEMLLRCKQTETMQAVQDLIEKRFPNFGFDDPGQLLRHAIRCDSTSMLSWLLLRGLDPNTPIDCKPYHEHEYALPAAIAAGRYGHAEILLEHSVDVNLCDFKKGTSLYAACERNQRTLMEQLLSLGARFEVLMWHWELCWEFVHRIASSGDVGMMDFIHSKGVDVMTHCDQCGSALSCAVRAENLDMIRYLVDKGCDVNELNMYGVRLLAWAEDDCLDDACSVLRGFGATKIANQGDVKLHIAASVSWLCQELSTSSASQEWPIWLSSSRWITLGRCLLLGNDPNNASIALEQTLYFDEDSLDKPGYTQQTYLALGGKLESHAHLMYPRPFFSADINYDYVALDETHHIPLEDWLESLREWKVKSLDQ